VDRVPAQPRRVDPAAAEIAQEPENDKDDDEQLDYSQVSTSVADWLTPPHPLLSTPPHPAHHDAAPRSRLAPPDPDIADNLGTIALFSRQYPEALAQYARARRLSKDNPRYQDETARALLQAGRTAQAAVWAQRALQLDNTFWYAHYVLALVNSQQGSKSQAKAEAQQALIWMRNYYPQPPASQINQLRALVQAG